MRRALALVLVLLIAGFGWAPRAHATPGVCTGRFVNPITDVCWSCAFPMTIGAFPIWPGSRPDPANPASPLCACGSPIPRIGFSVGFWEPHRLADVTMKPWCFTNLGGLKLDPGFDIGFRHLGPNTSDLSAENTGSWHVHWYFYPLLALLKLAINFACLEGGAFDLAYVTELDPLWASSELSMLINPEVVVFANPIAKAACAADCIAATAHLPADRLFWCAGCQGSMYPLNGHVQAQYGHIQGARLALSRFAYKLHRQLFAWGTMGAAGLCGKYPMPIMAKQQYRLQGVNPVPQVAGRWACAPPGASTALFGAGQMVPVIGEDFGFLVWRKRNCCVL